MKRFLALMCLLGFCLSGRAQPAALTLEDLVREGEHWLAENVDEQWLNSLPELDQSKVENFLRELRQRFQGEYVVDLASLKQGARNILPILELHEETQPYA